MRLRPVLLVSLTLAMVAYEPIHASAPTIRTPSVAGRAPDANWLRKTDSDAKIAYFAPRSWQFYSRPDKENLWKYKSPPESNSFAEIALSRSGEVSMDLATLAKALESLHLTSLPQFRMLNSSATHFGKSGRIAGFAQDFTFAVGEIPIRQRMIHFRTSAGVFTVSMLSRADAWKAVAPTFDTFLSAIEPLQGTAAAVSGANAAIPGSTNVGLQKTRLVEFRDRRGLISMQVPEGWRAEQDPGKELEVKFAGKNSAGLDAELFVTALPRGDDTSLEQFMGVVEETYHAPLKNYRKLKQQRISFGVGRVEGISTSVSFSAEGVPARQAAVYFADPKHFYCIALNAIGWSEPELRDTFERVLNTVKLH